MQYTDRDIENLRRLSTDRLKLMGVLVWAAGNVRIIKVFDKSTVDNKSEWKEIFKIDGLADDTPNKEFIESLNFKIFGVKPYGLIQLMVEKPFMELCKREKLALCMKDGYMKYTKNIAYYRGIVLDSSGNIIAENLNIHNENLSDTMAYDEYFKEMVEDQKGKILDHVIKYGIEKYDEKSFDNGYYPTMFPEISMLNWDKYQIASFGLPYHTKYEADFVVFNKDNCVIEAYGKRTASTSEGSEPIWIAVAEDSIVALDIFSEKVYIEKRDIPENDGKPESKHIRSLMLNIDTRREFAQKVREFGK